MEDQELPSESTSRPIFRQNLNKTTSSANTHTGNSSSSKVLNKNVKLTSTTAKRNNPKTKRQFGSRKKEHILNQHQNPKRQQQPLTIIVVLMTI
ncbi:unnamed protein product [Rotaria magnacalcarata]|uniref:Uncharacterized protein n=1 Tax=Rotaria magnacalcarata TaxID=392030 RepID=A0A8S2SQX7_9BILA|nr:unnamed protein product [Rotaria magnacalcarata]CAF5043948.1 unnamed protein product [Rotaria magnacalcarata]